MKRFWWISLFLFSSSVHGEELSKERIVFRTNYGDIVAALYPKVAPQHTEQILKLARKGIFTQTSIFRIEKGFVAQVENWSNRAAPLTPKQTREVIRIPAEFSDIPHHRGILSMARFDEDVDSAETSFSFVLGDAPHLDGQYTVFGEVVLGQEVLDAIERVPVENGSKPRSDVFIRKAEVVLAKDLSQVRLNGPMVPNVPEDPYIVFFKIFATVTFVGTVSAPFVKTLAGSALFRRRQTGLSSRLTH